MNEGAKFRVILDEFEGPLDVLVEIVEKNKYDIDNLPLVKIIDQYLDYVRMLQGENLAVESIYMLFAAKLIKLKAKMLLPRWKMKNDEIIAFQEELKEEIKSRKERNEEEQKFRENLEVLVNFFERKNKLFWDHFPSWKAQLGVDENYTHNLNDLFLAVKRIVERVESVSNPGEVIEDDAIDIKKRILELIKILREKNSEFFSRLLPDSPALRDIIEIFLALLELIKRGAIRVIQESIDGEILILPTPKINECKGIGEISL